MKNTIYLIFLLVILYSFNIEPNKNCITSKEISILKTEIKRIPEFKDYRLKKTNVLSSTISKNKCIGLFFITVPSIDNRQNLYIPFLKGTTQSIYNISLYEGKKILKDTFGIKSKLELILKDMRDTFTSEQIDSISTAYLYGVYTKTKIIGYYY